MGILSSGGVMQGFLDYFFKRVIDRPILTILLTIGLCMVGLAGVSQLRFTNDYRYFFTDQNPYLQAFEELERTYSSPDTVLIVVQPNEGPATSVQSLKLIGFLTEEGWQVPYSTRVDSITNFQDTTPDGDDLVVANLLPDPSNARDEDGPRVERAVRDNPFLDKRLLSEDGRTSGVLISLRPPRDDAAATTSIVTAVRGLKDRALVDYPNFRIEITGSQMLSNSFAESAQRDVQTLTPLMFVFISLLLILVTRQISATIAALIIIALSALTAVGIAGWLGIPMSPPASSAPTIIVTVAVANCVHIMITAMSVMSKGQAKDLSIIESLKINAQPVFLTSLTTAIGLFSLNFSDAPPYRDLGSISGIGAIVAWVLSMSLFPALLKLLPLTSNAVVEKQSAAFVNLAHWVIKRRQALLIGMMLLVVGLTAIIPRLTFNDRFVEYFDDRMDFRVASDFAADNLTGIYLLNYSLESDGAGGISEPEYLHNIDKLANWMRGQDEVAHVAVFSDIMKRINRSMNAGNQEFYRIPDNRELGAQYLLLYEMSLPYGLDLNDQINVDKSATRMLVTLHDIGTIEMRALRERTLAWMTDNLPTKMVVEPSGQAVMFSFIGERNFKTMAYGTLYAFILISLCLVLALRSPRLGLISLLPNIAPPAVAMGIFAIFNDAVGLWTSFVTATAIGLIVDATVHMLSKYRRARVELGYSSEEAVLYSFSTVGTALWVASLILIAGFLVLYASPFKVNAMLGLVVSLTIFVALILDFLLLPPLLMALDKKSNNTTT